MIKVLKFGGTSVGSAANMRRVGDIIRNEQARITVLSAMSGTTDALERVASLAAAAESPDRIGAVVNELKNRYAECARDLLAEALSQAEIKIEETCSLIEREALHFKGSDSMRIILAQGELLTTYIFTLYLRETGVNAVLLHAPSFMSKTRTPHVDREALARAMSGSHENVLYITQGFICSGADHSLDNLGRGGSDYSAALIGAAIGADEVQIWTDIDGIHNNDPRYVENTFPLRRMHFDEAEELAYFGAKILHPSTILPCKELGIPVLLKNTLDPCAPGTVISDREEAGRIYRAVAAKDNITVVRIYSTRMLMACGFLRKVFEVFERYLTPIDMITTSEVAVSLTIDDCRRLPEITADLEEFGSVEVESGNSIVCVVGRFDWGEHGRVAAIMEAATGVPLKMISYGASRRSVALLTETSCRTALLRNLNERLFSDYVECKDKREARRV